MNAEPSERGTLAPSRERERAVAGRRGLARSSLARRGPELVQVGVLGDRALALAARGWGPALCAAALLCLGAPLVGVVAGCGREEPQPAVARCPSWTVSIAGECRPRPWSVPSLAVAIGEPGAQLRGVAIDGTGLGLAVWDVAIAGRPAIGVGEELAPGLWTERDPAAALSGPDSSPAVAGGPDGAAMVTWVHAGRGEGVVAAERDAWGRWTDPGPGEVRSFPRSAVEPAVAASPDGEWVHAWVQQQGDGWGVSVARRASSKVPWERPAGADDVISPPVLFANQPQIALGYGGEALVTWYQSEGAPLMTYASQRRCADSPFSRPGVHDHLSAIGAPVASDPHANPIPAIGPRGEAAVVWVQENGAGATPVYLATRDAAGSWTRPKDLADAFSPPRGVARTARAAFGPEGTLFVVWAQGETPASFGIYGARRAPDGRWTVTGRAPEKLSSPDRTAYGPTLAVGPEGGAVAAWVEAWRLHKDRVVARRTGEDQVGWGAIEQLSGLNTAPAGAPAAAMGAGDRAIVGWSAGKLPEARVVVARVER